MRPPNLRRSHTPWTIRVFSTSAAITALRLSMEAKISCKGCQLQVFPIDTSLMHSAILKLWASIQIPRYLPSLMSSARLHSTSQARRMQRADMVASLLPIIIIPTRQITHLLPTPHSMAPIPLLPDPPLTPTDMSQLTTHCPCPCQLILSYPWTSDR